MRAKEPGKFSPVESLWQLFRIFFFFLIFILAQSCFPLVFVSSWYLSPIPFINKSKKTFNSPEPSTSINYLSILFEVLPSPSLTSCPLDTWKKCLNIYPNFSVILILFFTFGFILILGWIHALILSDLSHTWVFYTSHMSVPQPLITFLASLFIHSDLFNFLVYILLDRTCNPWPHNNLSLHFSLLWPLYKILLLYSIGFHPNLTICFQIS